MLQSHKNWEEQPYLYHSYAKIYLAFLRCKIKEFELSGYHHRLISIFLPHFQYTKLALNMQYVAKLIHWYICSRINLKVIMKFFPQMHSSLCTSFAPFAIISPEQGYSGPNLVLLGQFESEVL